MIKKKVSKNKKIISVLIPLIVVLFISAYMLTIFKISSNKKYTSKSMTMKVGTVTDIISGDTVEVKIGDRLEKIKLKGIAIPVEMKEEAMTYLSEEVKGKTVELHYSEEDYSDDFIKYGRLAAYLYFKNVLMNGSLIEKGFAITLGINDLKKSPNAEKILTTLEEEAKLKGRGIWLSTKDKASIAIESSTKQVIDSIGEKVSDTSNEIMMKAIDGVKEGTNIGIKSIKDVLDNIRD